MKLSIVIVNYNVKYFLKQCLASVYAAERQLSDGRLLELEVWVVDNDSVDGSTDMVHRDFPEVHVIENHDNVGFARANNQALQQASGDLLLLLNPDTVVEHDTFVLCADFVRQHPDCGGLTVKMVDGKGNYLRESKRGFPSPQASFYKIIGLTRLFPRSRRFAAYYMGHLGEDDINEIEIMPGAFLMVSHEAYNTIGGLDESYFMYGEDIDYSWRIRLAGYKNYYLPTTRIIHYKGESTRKGSLNYVYTFYNAMAIFVKKYFTGRNAHLFNLLLQTAIWLRAGLAGLRRIAARLAVPLLDFATAYGGFAILKGLWENIKGVGNDYYPPEYITCIVPLYILILMACSWLQGGYDRPVKVGRMVKGMGIGLLLLLAFYSLLDESQRYSRMLLLLGALWTLSAALLIRLVLSLCHIKGYALRARRRGTTLVVGDNDETARIQRLYTGMGLSAANLTATADSSARHLQDLIRIEREGDYIIGSENILSPDELYVTDLNTIITATARRTKRMFDIGTTLMIILLSPLLFWFQHRKKSYFSDCLQVLVGHLSWVGYTGRHGVFSPADILRHPSTEIQERLMLRYMRHYRTTTDWTILLRNWNNL